ncbi:MAG: ABC transporter ATP-binding protein [Candidatus Limnocylindria bacterium]
MPVRQESESRKSDERAVPGAAVSLRRIGLRFSGPRGLDALHDLDLDVPAGNFTAVIGPNGSGKSTLLRIVAGLLAPTSGSVMVGGTPPRAGDGRVAVVFQQPRLVPWRTTLENVALPLELAGVDPTDRRRRAGAALERVGLAQAADRYPRELSGGMQQRAALARALTADPQVLLLDEPFSSLDALTREAFDAQLESLWVAERRTVILVTHLVGEAVRLADRVAVLGRGPGRIVRVLQVDLPRPRPLVSAEDGRAAAIEHEIRSALASQNVDAAAWGDAA